MEFKIDPVRLCIDNKKIINDRALDILRRYSIELLLDVTFFKRCDTSLANTIVLIHGNSSSQKAFKAQANFYTASGYNVVTLDLLGHGGSSKIADMAFLDDQEKNTLAEAFYNPCALIAEIKQFLSDSNLYDAHLIGWSLGGHILYGIAVEEPRLVASITTIGSPPVKFNNAGLKNGFRPFFLEFVESWKTKPARFTRANAEDLVKDGWGYAAIDASNQYMVDDLINTDPLLRKYLFLNIDKYEVPALNGEAFVKNTSIPVYLIVARNDKGINANYYLNLNRQFKHRLSKVYIQDRGGHTLLNSYSISTLTWIQQLCGLEQSNSLPSPDKVAKVTEPLHDPLPIGPRL